MKDPGDNKVIMPNLALGFCHLLTLLAMSKGSFYLTFPSIPDLIVFLIYFPVSQTPGSALGI